jgi:xanthine/CO dehydrogenase XdhC/CoxF family maturation factor
VVAWPDEFLKTAEVDKRSVICVLTHDPKFDVPVPGEALKTEAGYIGAMGSRRTHNNRTARLKEEGRHRRATRARQQPDRAGHRGEDAGGDGHRDAGRSSR